LYAPESEFLASLKSIVAARLSPLLEESPPCSADTCGIGGLMLLP